jgi:hypothetical protein
MPPEPEREFSADAGDYMDATVQEGKAWFAAQRELIALTLYEKAGQATGALLVGLLVAVPLLAFLLFASVALALWLGGLFGSTAWGFLATGGLYLLVALVVRFLARDAIRDALTLNVINSFHDGQD